MNQLFIYILSFAVTAMAVNMNVNQLLTPAINLFSAQMFSEVMKSHPDKNVVLSPFSVMSPLAQLGIASVGVSHDEILRIIGMPNDNATKELYSHNNLNSKLGSTKDIEILMANKIYVSKKYEVNKDFAEVSKQVFNSEIMKLDFTKNVDSAQEINSWVAEQTKDHIKNLVTPNMINPSTNVVLVNAIYFKGIWQNRFIKSATKHDDFFMSKDKIVQVPTMNTMNYFKYIESPELNAQVLELPYLGDQASLVIILPNEIDGLNELKTKLTDPTVLDKVHENMFQTAVEVHLPKFKIETQSDLKQVLINMNVTKLFSRNANLNNLLENANNIFVSDAIQKAFIEVNEEGTEAAAANAFIAIGSAPIFQPPKVFRANRPFYFVLKKNSVPLFSGVVVAP